MMLSQILIWWLFLSFSGTAMVASEGDGGQCFGEAQVSLRMEL
jgi:hypothetical protein